MIKQRSTLVNDQIENPQKNNATKAIDLIHGFIARNERYNYETTWNDGATLNSIAEDIFPDKLFHALNRPFRKKDFPQNMDLSGHMNNRNPHRAKRISKRLSLWEKKFEESLQKNVQFKHALNFRSVTIRDKTYEFNKQQAIAINFLWEAHQNPEKIGVNETDIGKAIETISTRYHLLQTFRQRRNGKRGMHPAWKELIEHVGYGLFRLNIQKPEDVKSL